MLMALQSLTTESFS